MALDRVPIDPATIAVGQTVILSREVTVTVTAVQIGARLVGIQGTVVGGDDAGNPVTVKLPKGSLGDERGRAWRLDQRPPPGSARRLADGSVWSVGASGRGHCVQSGTQYVEGQTFATFAELGPSVRHEVP